MGLFDNLFGGGDKRREKTIEKASKKLKNPHVQTAERKRQIEVLTEIGSPEAVFALLGRFSMRTPGSIVDEDEKQMVYQSLLQLGDVTIESIQRFIGTQDAVYWPLRALTEIAGDDVAIDTLMVALEKAEHGYNADMDRREQLVANLREFLDAKRVIDRLIELADDPHEEVRILALDSLCETDDPRVSDLIVRKVTSEEETHRVKSTLFTILVDRRIDMSQHREALGPLLPEHLWIDGNGIVQRK